MAELLSIRSRADKDDIRSASNRHLATYRHLEQFLTAFTCEKDNEKDTCFTKSLPFCNSPLEINRVNKQLGKVEKTQDFSCLGFGRWISTPPPPTQHFNRKMVLQQLDEIKVFTLDNQTFKNNAVFLCNMI